jgi:hypothetical protein
MDFDLMRTPTWKHSTARTVIARRFFRLCGMDVVSIAYGGEEGVRPR